MRVGDDETANKRGAFFSGSLSYLVIPKAPVSCIHRASKPKTRLRTLFSSNRHFTFRSLIVPHTVNRCITLASRINCSRKSRGIAEKQHTIVCSLLQYVDDILHPFPSFPQYPNTSSKRGLRTLWFYRRMWHFYRGPFFPLRSGYRSIRSDEIEAIILHKGRVVRSLHSAIRQAVGSSLTMIGFTCEVVQKGKIACVSTPVQ